MIAHRTAEAVRAHSKFIGLARDLGARWVLRPGVLEHDMQRAFLTWLDNSRKAFRVYHPGEPCFIDFELRFRPDVEISFIFREYRGRSHPPPRTRSLGFRYSSVRSFIFAKGTEGYADVGPSLNSILGGGKCRW